MKRIIIETIARELNINPRIVRKAFSHPSHVPAMQRVRIYNAAYKLGESVLHGHYTQLLVIYSPRASIYAEALIRTLSERRTGLSVIGIPCDDIRRACDTISEFHSFAPSCACVLGDVGPTVLAELEQSPMPTVYAECPHAPHLQENTVAYYDGAAALTARLLADGYTSIYFVSKFKNIPFAEEKLHGFLSMFSFNDFDLPKRVVNLDETTIAPQEFTAHSKDKTAIITTQWNVAAKLRKELPDIHIACIDFLNRIKPIENMTLCALLPETFADYLVTCFVKNNPASSMKFVIDRDLYDSREPIEPVIPEAHAEAAASAE